LPTLRLENLKIKRARSNFLFEFERKWDQLLYLKESFNSEKNYLLTCFHSKITKKLLIDLKQVNEEFIQELEMNQAHIMWVGNSTFNVTLLSANHCSGAVMFLFER
jgi:hypothetical protein